MSAELPTGARRGVVITVSTRAAAGIYEDQSGPVVAQALRELALAVDPPVVVADGEPFRVALDSALASQPAVIITSGGTGISPSDQTPQLTRARLEVELPHLSAAISHHGVSRGVPTAVLSRGVAGIAGRTLMINVPGSVGGARDAMTVVAAVLPHALDQLDGVDHERAG